MKCDNIILKYIVIGPSVGMAAAAGTLFFVKMGEGRGGEMESVGRVFSYFFVILMSR